MNKALAQKNHQDYEVMNDVVSITPRSIIEKCKRMELANKKTIVLTKSQTDILIKPINERLKGRNAKDNLFFTTELNTDLDKSIYALQKNERYMNLLADGNLLTFKNFKVYLKLECRTYAKDRNNKIVLNKATQASLFKEFEEDTPLIKSILYTKLWILPLKSEQEEREQYYVFDVDNTELGDEVEKLRMEKAEKKIEELKQLAKNMDILKKAQELEETKQNSLLESNNRNTFTNRADIFN